MKILILQDFLRSGGTERQTVLLANAFASAGDAVSLLTFRPGGQLNATVAASVQRSSLQTSDLRLDWLAPRLVERIRARAPDIVLCMGRMANCYAGRIQERLPGTRVVMTLRTGRSIPALFRRSLRVAAHVIANSTEARHSAVHSLGVPEERISVIHNALVFAAPARSERAVALRAKLGAEPNSTVLLCVAMFRPEKNQRELIEIVSGLPKELDWRLWLAGDGPARAACERLSVRRKLGARVRFCGWQKDPSELYAAADIAIHASRSESLSNFIIEAQANGLAAVAYEALGIRECFLPGDTGVAIPRGDRGAFRDAIARFAADPVSSRKARARRAREFARSTFDPDRQVAAHRRLFRELLPS